MMKGKIMANPLRFRIKDLTGTCFDGLLNRAGSVVERKHCQALIDALTSVRPLDNLSATYAMLCLGVAGYRENVDFELVKLELAGHG